MPKDSPVKLHLGCQGNYLKGYINIDLPPDEQTVEKTKADVYADVRDLKYKERSVDEVRAHHLLEHFNRSEALTLLSRWHHWLKFGGVLMLETPDFFESAKKFVNSQDLNQQFILGRHIFGSHEADWAYHLDFWYEEKYRYTLGELGFGNFRFEKFSNNLEQKLPAVGKILKGKEKLLKNFQKLGFNNLPNIICHATKIKDKVDYQAVAKKILSKYLVGRERKILNVWLKDFGLKIKD